MTGEERMWMAVILQAFQDMAIQTQNNKLLQRKQAAAYWLQHPSKYLFMVCDMCGLEPEKVMTRARRDGLRLRGESGKSKRYEYDRLYKLRHRPVASTMGLPAIPREAYHEELVS